MRLEETREHAALFRCPDPGLHAFLLYRAQAPWQEDVHGRLPDALPVCWQRCIGQQRSECTEKPHFCTHA